MKNHLPDTLKVASPLYKLKKANERYAYAGMDCQVVRTLLLHLRIINNTCVKQINAFENANQMRFGIRGLLQI